MAITTNISILKNANAGIPSAYTPATLPTLANKTTKLFETDLAVGTIENADPTVALTNLETDLTTYLTGTFYDTILHLDALDTITCNITVTRIERVRQEENDLLPGGEFFKVSFTCDWY